MKNILLLTLTLLYTMPAFAQAKKTAISSGNYEGMLNLAYNPTNNIVTGFFESYTGCDEETKAPRFSCIFYIEGKPEKGIATIKTYYPLDRENDIVKGTLKILPGNKVSILLPEEHGGCWNVQHFADKPAEFTLSEKLLWIEIRYITTEKAFFHTQKDAAAKRKSYLVKGDIVYIDKIEGNWLHGKYIGKTVTEGWFSAADLNSLVY